MKSIQEAMVSHPQTWGVLLGEMAALPSKPISTSDAQSLRDVVAFNGELLVTETGETPHPWCPKKLLKELAAQILAKRVA